MLSNNSNDDKSSSQSHFSELAFLYKDNSKKQSFDLRKPLFGNRRASFQKVLANANKAIEKSTKFINKIKSRELACANRAKSIPENATIRKEYIKCGKEVCEQKHGPYYYAYWKDPEDPDLTTDYSLFVYAIKSPVTREYYLRRLRRFFDFLGLKEEMYPRREM